MLFDLDNPESQISTNHFSEINHPARFISSQDDYLSKHLRKINFDEKNKNYHFTSNGRFALHDIVIFCANKIGGANAYITSFNISVIAAKSLVRAWDKGIFKYLAFVLNAQKKHNFKEAINLIEGKFPIKFTAIHAKVALIWNDKQFITVITSGNLSNNNNYERGVISTSKSVFNFDKKWIGDLLPSDTE